jgi:hypothetical protein
VSCDLYLPSKFPRKRAVRGHTTLSFLSQPISTVLGEPLKMTTDIDHVKKFEKDVITFSGYGGKVSFAQFDKYMARYMRMRYGGLIGEGLWMDTMPSIEETGRLTNPNFALHCQDVFDSIAVCQASRVKLYKPPNSPFWTREWQTKWRQDEWERTALGNHQTGHETRS